MALLSGLMLWPCGSCVPAGQGHNYAGPRERSPAVIAYYSYPKQVIVPRIELRKRKKSYDILRIEFASALNEPRAPLVEATDVFVRARYGPSDPSDGDVAAAERGAAAVLDHLARRPPRRRPGVMKDAETAPPREA